MREVGNDRRHPKVVDAKIQQIKLYNQKIQKKITLYEKLKVENLVESVVGATYSLLERDCRP